MNYFEVTFKCIPDTEINKDVLTSLLGEIGFESFVEKDRDIAGYIAEKLFSESKIKDLIKEFPFEAEITYETNFIAGQNWNEEWEKNFFEPIIIDDRCAIRSSFHKDIPQVKYDIVIDPKMSFGTGHHETTSLMIAWLLESDLIGKSLLDMGCGTAVLAILARMKGADPVLAIDIDEWAYQNSLENVKLNHTEDIEVKQGGAEILPNEKFDIILANINRNILLNDIQFYAKCMKAGSELYLSGFYSEDIPAIVEECSKYGLKYTSHTEKNNWVALKIVS